MLVEGWLAIGQGPLKGVEQKGAHSGARFMTTSMSIAGTGRTDLIATTMTAPSKRGGEKFNWNATSSRRRMIP
jgi:hypothetical protein